MSSDQPLPRLRFASEGCGRTKGWLCVGVVVPLRIMSIDSFAWDGARLGGCIIAVLCKPPNEMMLFCTD
jgi:hypothetical protein